MGTQDVSEQVPRAEGATGLPGRRVVQCALDWLLGLPAWSCQSIWGDECARDHVHRLKGVCDVVRRSWGEGESSGGCSEGITLKAE